MKRLEADAENRPNLSAGHKATMAHPGIRVNVLCVFSHQGRILVAPGYDRVKQERFFRPLGGSVEFGEAAIEALRREIREELNQDFTAPALLGVLESRFVCDGTPGHEILFVFDARFIDTTLYKRASLPFTEPVGTARRCGWIRTPLRRDRYIPMDWRRSFGVRGMSQLRRTAWGSSPD